MLTAFDYAVLAVIALSALRGAWRGFVSEIFGLIGWIAAIVIAGRYVGLVVPYIPANWPGGALTQWVIAFALVVIGVVLVAGVANALLSRIAQASGLGGVDRSLGMMFGRPRLRAGGAASRGGGADRAAQTGILAQCAIASFRRTGRARAEAAPARRHGPVRTRVTTRPGRTEPILSF